MDPGPGPQAELRARSALAISNAEAPSLICDEVPAVIDHSICGKRCSMASSTNAGRSAARASRVVGRSALVGGEPGGRRRRRSTGTISVAKAPQLVAPAASSWERSPNSSISWRDTPHLAAISSAATPWDTSPSG